MARARGGILRKSAFSMAYRFPSPPQSVFASVSRTPVHSSPSLDVILPVQKSLASFGRRQDFTGGGRIELLDI
jgi:hypothetical protein